MKLSLFYNQYKIRILSPYLYAEYPSLIPNKTMLKDSKKFPRGESGYYWDAIEVSGPLNSILSNMILQNNFLELSEVIEIFSSYSQKAKREAVFVADPTH